MISFIVCMVALLVGYRVYGSLAVGVFAPDNTRLAPAVTKGDGVDFVPLKTKKAFLVQLLNIAGTGPIFGALAGAVFGPIVFLWIVLGSVLGGAVHDYMSGMISMRNDGASVTSIIGKYMGKIAKVTASLFIILILVLVGAVFVTSPASLLAQLTPDGMGLTFWSIIILLYYVLATLMPIDKIIGKVYPVFGVVLVLMAVGVFFGLIFNGYQLAEISLVNLNASLPVFPFMFITVACGAISGFHATQSPLMAKCISSEKEGKKVFYGAMILESVIALVWASVGVAFYENSAVLSSALSVYGASQVVYDISVALLGTAGGILAVIGVVICPITSGDTAFRSARLIIAEFFNFDQKKIKNRLILTIPLLLVGGIFTMVNFDILWRYFAWSNQTLGAFFLWCCSIYLIKHNKGIVKSLITALPATFMTAVCLTYIIMADVGFAFSAVIGYSIGISLAVASLVVFFVWALKYIKKGVYEIIEPTATTDETEENETQESEEIEAV